MSKHTAGPWIAVGHWVEHADGNRPDICNCSPESMGQEHLGASDEEAAANAHLIAAAPELLHVLQEILADGVHCDVVPHLHRKARAAIAKATGGEA